MLSWKGTSLYMKLAASWLILPLILLGASFGQTNTSDPYKPVLDRLESLSRQSESEWRFHADIPHPEDPTVNDSDWAVYKVKNLPTAKEQDEERWTGTRVFRRWIEIPEKINGYSTRGSQVRLNLRFTSPDTLAITVFSNGAILYRGNDDDILPVLLTESAQPGQKFLVAARVVGPDDVQAEFFHSELNLQATSSRPDPGLLRT